MPFTRITVDPAVMGGMPCIGGLRVQILTDLPYLEPEDITESLRPGAAVAASRVHGSPVLARASGRSYRPPTPSLR
jgi:uncharacterized protein (DUF433 family)